MITKIVFGLCGLLLVNEAATAAPKATPYWVDPRDGRRVSRKATRSRSVAEMRALGYEKCLSPGKHCFKWVLR